MHTLIIAEAGVNHNGNLEIAKRLIDVAAAAGVDFVKFQTYKTEKLVSKTAQKAIYQKKNVNDGDSSQYKMLKKLELSEDMHVDLISYCTQKDIKFLSTGFDESSIDYLEKLDVELFKVPSGEITNKPYLKHIASKGKPVIISTGMSSISEIKDALEVLMSKGLPRDLITVLHCNTEYPTPMEDVNLKAMLTIQKELNVKIGYSDHTLGIEVPIAAVAMGANVIEKHFTLDRSMDGPDHLASLEPDELKQMVKAIRNVELALSGSGEKKPSESEQKNLAVARKSIVAAQKIKKGEILSSDNITVKRPGNGVSPMMWDEVIGSKAKRNFEEDEAIEL
ncbi:N-acetylneuraminate synthase [Albibacterium sp.]|uniref:N-acetylneuraminate synthase n=1 Tax=Albibacterium sp. TaxID=2952885 RepID=UPI002CC6334E|nr:N-acetylneuraminate synthase [Albibacterium sp.]HUH18006.1 N-acetylneuraminate synthase [Albibacterium sp.]